MSRTLTLAPQQLHLDRIAHETSFVDTRRTHHLSLGEDLPHRTQDDALYDTRRGGVPRRIRWAEVYVHQGRWRLVLFMKKGARVIVAKNKTHTLNIIQDEQVKQKIKDQT